MSKAFKRKAKELTERKSRRVTFKGWSQNNSDAISARDQVSAIQTIISFVGSDLNKHRIRPEATLTHLAWSP